MRRTRSRQSVRLVGPGCGHHLGVSGQDGEMIRVRLLSQRDLAWRKASLEGAWGGTVVARRGEALDALLLEGFVALDHSSRVGLLTYVVRGDEFEVVSLCAHVEGVGVGQALMNAALKQAEALGARRLWLRTTNNNFRAFRFYQRWGMDFVALDREGVARSRKVKPSIPAVDREGVPIRHELEFELMLTRVRP